MRREPASKGTVVLAPRRLACPRRCQSLEYFTTRIASVLSFSEGSSWPKTKKLQSSPAKNPPQRGSSRGMVWVPSSWKLLL